MYLWSENDYSFSLVYAFQPCGTGKEPDLASFEMVVKAVQARIDEGWLKAGDSLELCYGQTARLVNGGTKKAGKTDEMGNPDAAK